MATQDDVRSDLLELAERVEAYDPKLSPDNRADESELDEAIAEALGWVAKPGYDWRFQREFRRPDGALVNAIPKFTRSLDAAMTLVPEGCAINVVRTADGQRAHANLYRFDGNSECIPSAKFGGSATTPALALCAAALKSLAQKEGE